MQDALIQEEEEGQRIDKNKAAAKAAADKEKKQRKKVSGMRCFLTRSHLSIPVVAQFGGSWQWILAMHIGHVSRIVGPTSVLTACFVALC